MRRRAQAAIKQPSAATRSLARQAAIKLPSATAVRLHGQAAIKSPSAITRRLRAQAAMEFLMTYGWAILIMLVVISMLFYLGVFNQSTSTAKSCILPSGLSCYDFDIDEMGSITLDLGQSTGKPITVYGVGCGINSTPALTTLPAPVTIQSGTHARVTGPSAGVSISCSGASGPSFKGKIAIKYSTQNSVYNKTVYGDVSGPLMNATSGGSATDLTGVWILVPGNPTYGTSDFYVMKYEAKNNGSNYPASTAAGTPWVAISLTSARANCTAIGAHVMTAAEAQTISRDVASVASNWMSGVVGTGCMYGGHLQCSYSGSQCSGGLSASSNDAEAWWNGTQDAHNTTDQRCPYAISNTWGNETRRTMYLSNGNVIWDWNANLYEYVNDTCQPGSGWGYWNTSAYIQWDHSDLDDYERQTLGPPNSGWTSTVGAGRYYGCQGSGYVILHGGAWSTASYAGPFSVWMGGTTGQSWIDTTFRCARPA